MKAYFETNECVEPFLDLISELTFCWTWATWAHVSFRGSCPNCTGDVFWNFRIRPPRNRPYYKGDMISDLVRQVNLVQFPFCRWNFHYNQNVPSFPPPKASVQGIFHIFRVWCPHGFNASAPCHYGWGFSAWRMLGSGKAWHPCCRFFLMVECLFWLAYVSLSQQELYKSTFFLKCRYCVV